MSLNINDVFMALNRLRESKEIEISTKIAEMNEPSADGTTSTDTTKQMELSKLMNEWEITVGTQTNTTKAIASAMQGPWQNIK